MFHLTPQERLVVAVLLTVALTGSIVRLSLSMDAPLTRWVSHAREHRKPILPDINQSNADQLVKLPGIGPKTAYNIVEYRKANGPFMRLDELRKVKGITRSNFRKIEEAYARP